jgi:hypothetical protein
MPAGGVVLLVVAVLFLIVVIRLIAGGADDGRIRQYIASRGGVVQSIQWQPFGRGWFGEKNDRIYLVTYTDSSGDVHEASCKTSLFSGVYLSEDRLIKQSRRAEPEEDLRAENERLREELRRLRGEG